MMSILSVDSQDNHNMEGDAKHSSDRPSGIKKRLSAAALKSSLGKLTAVGGPVSGVQFVPADVPRKRRLQTLAVATWNCMIVITTCSWFFLWSIPPLWPLLAVYFVWATFLDQASENGGRASHFLRSSRFWRYLADYYPVTFMKEADLPADRPYVFGYHPHGIIGTGAQATFGTEALGFSKAFPGIRPHLLTLTTNFQMPFYRDILLAMGICSVSKNSCLNILRSGPGSAITIVVGGAAESLRAHPGTADLTLRRRLGFIKLAIQCGADLVPVFSFGENDIYQQMPNEKGTTVYRLQRKFQAIFGFTLPLFHGRGLLNYNVGLMPYRRRIIAVIGKPIQVKQHDKPDLEEVMEVQQRYISELTRIWDTYKDEFAKTRLRELRFID